MTLPVQPNLYCSPQDIYELAGDDSVQLRLDDKNLASGQIVQTTADAAIGAGTISVVALQYPMLRGTRLVFSLAQMPDPVEVTLSAVAAIGATSLSVVPLVTAVTSGAEATDNGVNVWLASLMSKACKYATARVKSYCSGRYNDTDLVNSWSVNNWATIIAAHWLAKRRYLAAPSGIDEDYKETMEELRRVQSSQLNIEDIGTRTSAWPFMSNVTIDLGYTYRKVRVEPTISEPTPTQFPQSVDYASIFLLEL